MSEGKIILGISGGIAAYKTVELARELTKRGYQVFPVLTAGAENFVTSLSLATVTGNKVLKEIFTEADPILHISLTDEADLILIAPATANIIGKIANGIADDLLTTIVAAKNCPVLICPAMNTRMYQNSIVQENLNRLVAHGFNILEPDSGSLACGHVGPGRLPDIPEIIAEVEKLLQEKILRGIKVLVTAGPTREYIDPVRFITNKSSGKMGFALAEAFRNLGAEVYLVSGPVSLAPPTGVNFISVETTEEMAQRVDELFEKVQIVVKAAAVADYTPKEKFQQKLPKKNSLTIDLIKTKDILKSLGERKVDQFLVGFAAQTHDLENYATKKLLEKNLDMIAANDVSRTDIGFDSEENEIVVYTRDGEKILIPRASKKIVAQKLARLIGEKYLNKQNEKG
ncbi:bifunctional phosphopantothenoylcysteine decarboxylase/phosphopantothenate--cysteine ligase CoaBC [Carboxydothermus hydrogenoformans]|uniref:Coenzyme A biosynthesis bifunctional protein CoaBC n=1 Tax=Carboxydothermus hydrogenoformans (strain ATCC BAA-161 / DSM 6008 / Z-2901) TaxID=246194 RepID=Q3AC16_CARHZ|nr:bifunctional phosphopantothenoylcysteine decarboxylase/phosphopantothenate--cysteine ligase CoaBC [Carboxydothermus hydrogenoformans]ABB14118.1 phosphopantothenoylcysteine decarboxylase/phosphopantothenate--cysteine ligase [Carboxydothermus hydrogenoformans Z-2901]